MVLCQNEFIVRVIEKKYWWALVSGLCRSLEKNWKFQHLYRKFQNSAKIIYTNQETIKQFCFEAMDNSLNIVQFNDLILTSNVNSICQGAQSKCYLIFRLFQAVCLYYSTWYNREVQRPGISPLPDNHQITSADHLGLT